MCMTSQEIRQCFFDFFKSKGHDIQASAPIVIKNDPSLMFTNAGMNQFKAYFLGDEVPKSVRIANTQKCLRVSGKHNDLEEVGVDTYHHTMFEMLGNWSFGDYFKEEAINWAWELLTNVYKVDASRLYATVFQGDEEDGVPFDKEAYDIWAKIIPEERILKCNKEDNFWEMGDIGPCGPCSEIHVDLRSDEERAIIDGSELVNKDNPLVIEVWNLVFMEFNRKADRTLELLKNKHVDTGMGLERLAMILQQKTSNYDSDIFQGLIGALEKASSKQYGLDEKTDIAFRVIVDHVRAIAFSIADGQLPSNVKAGYVIRRILRRAVRYAYSFLNIKEAVIYTLTPLLCKQFKLIFPEIDNQSQLIAKVIEEEEKSFLRTLNKGLHFLEDIESKNKKAELKEITGKQAFDLYDTYGFPLDLTALIAYEKGMELDEKGFHAFMKEQKERSRAAAEQKTSDWIEVHSGNVNQFVGYDMLECEAKVQKYRCIEKGGKEIIQLVLNQTPFYAESGGQVGDKGVLRFGDEVITVFDCKKEQNLFIHYCNQLPSEINEPLIAMVEGQRRHLIKGNHSATHLLQAALIEVLGAHVQQKGSFLNDAYLRFDFTHFQKVELGDLAQIENIVNERIQEANSVTEHRRVPKEKALAMGATALFGEKYGEEVRVIQICDDYSVELCGGTHVNNTAEIGLFKIKSESAVAAGIRRIEAVTSSVALKSLNDQAQLLNDLKSMLNNAKNPKQALGQLIEENVKLKESLEEFELKEAQALKAKIENNIKEDLGVQWAIEHVSGYNNDLIKNMAFELKAKYPKLCLIVGNVLLPKVNLTLALSDELVQEKNLNAGKIIRECSSPIQGGGGGQAFYATAGGKNPNGLDEAIENIKNKILAS